MSLQPTFVLSVEAELDLSGIIEYVADRNLNSAIEMLDRIEQARQTLAENPDLGELRQGYGVLNCRSFTVSRYVIFFQSNGNGIDVARILDGSRDI